MRLTLAIAVLAAVFCLDVPMASARGAAPWCAVVSSGPAEVEWDCNYYSIEECRPNVLAGNRGSCIQNPRAPDVKFAPKYRHKRHHRRH
jgi:hypothetical protein